MINHFGPPQIGMAKKDATTSETPPAPTADPIKARVAQLCRNLLNTPGAHNYHAEAAALLELVTGSEA